jgi:glutaredoxin
MKWVARIAFVLMMIGAIIQVLEDFGLKSTDDLRGKLAPGNEVVMYSLTTCPYCAKTRAYLDESGIPYTEHFLDTDKEAEREFYEMLTASGAPSGSVGTPSLIVNDMLLLNNPPFENIKRHLKLKGG